MNVSDFGRFVSDVIECLTTEENVPKCVSTLKSITNAIPSKDSDSGDYLRLLNCLLDGVNAKWFQEVCNGQLHLYEDCFFQWKNKEAVLLLLTKAVSETRPSLKLETSVCLLEKFLSTNHFIDLILELCIPNVDSLQQDLLTSRFIYLISSIVSLPDKTAAVIDALPSRIGDKLHYKAYLKLVSEAVIKSLNLLHNRIQNSMDVNLEFLRVLIGRSCLSGHTEDVLTPIIRHFVLKTENDYIWRRLSQQLLIGVSDQFLEIIITSVLKNCNRYNEVQRLIGDAVLTDKRVYRLLTHKLLLVRCFQDTNFLYNLLGYLSAEKTQHILVEIFFRVIDVWGNKSNFKFRQFHQHLYLTKTLIISLSFMNVTKKLDNKAVILQKMMKSMDAHLSCPLKSLHQVGMVTAKLICKAVDPTGPQLEFKYENDEIALELESLVGQQYNPISNDLLKNETPNEESPNDNTDKCVEIPIASNLDSDDDLEPYDMSNDTVKKKYDKPRYLRDCVDGLLVHDDVDRLQISLETVESLVRQESVGLNEVAVELTKILLCLENIGTIENFTSLRFGAMVALAVKCPKPVAIYLCEQFYLRNYNIRQRMDILEVLAAAAREISKPKQTERMVTLVKVRDQTVDGNEDWKGIVQNRIDGKTRYFHKTHVKKEIVGSSNSFSSVAGYFFFPLVSAYDNRENSFDLLGGDFFLLGRLLWCLGTVLHASENCPIAIQMGVSVLEFVAAIRYHTEPYVRRALIFAVCEVIASVPANYLLSTLQEKIIESSAWLKDVVEHDTDPECQRLAVKTLMLLDSVIKEAAIELPGASGSPF